MNAGVTAERVHDALRARIMDNAFRPGERLDPAGLARELVSSVTPVRDALHRLAGEGLVETQAAGGFRLPGLDEPLLHDLYQWSAQLLHLAIACWPRVVTANAVDDIGTASAAERSVTPIDAPAVFARIAGRSTNSQHHAAIGLLNARLQAVRVAESSVLDLTAENFAPWMAAMVSDERTALRRLVLRYHRRRHQAAAAVLRALYRVR